jgi:hypothetical protein
LIEVLQNDPFEYVRVAAARALRTHLGVAGARDALRHAVESDADASVRRAARDALE